MKPRRRLRLRATVEVFPASDGHLYLLAGEDRHLRIRDPDALQRDLIMALTRGGDEEEMVDRLRVRGHQAAPATVRAAIASLQAAGLVEDADDDARYGLTASRLERFERQLRYFGDLQLGAPRAQLQSRLAGSRVVVLGLGGLGSWSLQALACTGVGHITAVDFDRVELSNLSRQSMYRERDIGRLKTECAARWMAGFSPSTRFDAVTARLTGSESVVSIIEGADLVLGLVDCPVGLVESWINRACRQVGAALLSASQFPPTIRIGPLYKPGERGCHNCLLARVRADFPLFDELAAWRRRAPSPAATFGPASALIGGLLANEAVNYLAEICTPATQRSSILLDLRSLEMRRDRLAPDPDCEVCAPS